MWVLHVVQGGTALWHAAAGGHAGAVHELLEGGRADHHVANGEGMTPLHAAILAQAKACIAMLQVCLHFIGDMRVHDVPRCFFLFLLWGGRAWPGWGNGRR